MNVVTLFGAAIALQVLGSWVGSFLLNLVRIWDVSREGRYTLDRRITVAALTVAVVILFVTSIWLSAMAAHALTDVS